MLCRLAREKDRTAIVELGRSLGTELVPHLKYDEIRANATITRAVASGNPTIFVVEDHDVVIGFLLAGRYDYAAFSGFYLQQDIFYVRPDKRGSRAAAKLFAGFVRWAQNLHPEEVFAGIGWGRRSTAAARWLGRFGFEPAGQQIMRRRMGGR